MIVGHYATALVATEKAPRAPFWWLLLASNIADFVMMLLVVVGIESMEPSSMFEATLENLRTDMRYTHDLLPVMGWTMGIGALAFAVWRDAATAIWSALLVAFHEACDLVSGFHHYVFTPDSPRVGLALYTNAPELALVIEAALGVGCVWWFARSRKTRGSPVSPWGKRWLYGLVIFGPLAQLANARTSMSEMLGM
ncbi:MAG: hypothetical protein AAF500_22540 [Myxococcota bacterium]